MLLRTCAEPEYFTVEVEARPTFTIPNNQPEPSHAENRKILTPVAARDQAIGHLKCSRRVRVFATLHGSKGTDAAIILQVAKEGATVGRRGVFPAVDAVSDVFVPGLYDIGGLRGQRRPAHRQKHTQNIAAEGTRKADYSDEQNNAEQGAATLILRLRLTRRRTFRRRLERDYLCQCCAYLMIVNPSELRSGFSLARPG